jgi:hypothetical protein
MSEYQYYEFCSLHSPLSAAARKEMSALSSRAQVGTHSASYVYNYSDFRGNPEALLLKYFDVFFYISNWGTIRLMFKYPAQEIEIKKLKKYSIKDVISCQAQKDYVVLNIAINNEEGFGWTDGEGLLADFLPLYEEIQSKNYQFLQLIKAIHDELTGEKENALASTLADMKLSAAQSAFLDHTGVTVA